MSKEERNAWILTGFGGVIIILLLLDWGNTTNVVEPSTGGVSWPNFDPITLQLTSVPPGGYPFYINVGGPTSGDTYSYQAGSPCGCGCSGASEVAAQDFGAQIDYLNSSIKNGTINAVKSFFSGLPGTDYWTTNNTQIDVFNGLVGLPPSPYGA